MDVLVSDLCLNEIDGECFIEWRTKSDFEYIVHEGDAVKVSCKPACGFYRKGLVHDPNEFGFYLRMSPIFGSPQTYIAYEDVFDIQLND